MQAVAARRYRRLDEERLRVSEQQAAQRLTTFEFLPERPRPQTHRAARHLHHGLERRGVRAQNERQPQHPLAPFYAHFNLRPVLHHGSDGDRAKQREIDVSDAFLRLVEDLTTRKRYIFEARANAHEIVYV